MGDADELAGSHSWVSSLYAQTIVNYNVLHPYYVDLV